MNTKAAPFPKPVTEEYREPSTMAFPEIAAEDPNLLSSPSASPGTSLSLDFWCWSFAVFTHADSGSPGTSLTKTKAACTEVEVEVVTIVSPSSCTVCAKYGVQAGFPTFSGAVIRAASDHADCMSPVTFRMNM